MCTFKGGTPVKKGSLFWTIWNIFAAAVFVVLGIVAIANARNVDFRNAIILVAGIILIVLASLQLLFNVINVFRLSKETVVFKTNYGVAVGAASELSVGILLILVSSEQTSMEVIFHYLANFIGILLIVLGAVAVFYAILYLVKKVNSVTANIGSIIGGAIVITLGILAIIFLNKEDNFLVFFFTCFGILFLLFGLCYLFLTIYTLITLKKAKKDAGKAQEVTLDQSVVEVEEVKDEKSEENPSDDNPTDKPE